MRWLLLFFVTAAWADIDPGNWEIIATTETQGINEATSLTQTRCLTPEEVRDPSRLFGASPAARCQFTSRHDTGAVFTFEMECEPQQIRGSGSVRYNRDSLEGELELKADNFTARARIRARRIGDC